MTLQIDVYIVDPSATVSLVRCYTTVYKTPYNMNPMGGGVGRGGAGGLLHPLPLPSLRHWQLGPPIFWYKIAKY